MKRGFSLPELLIVIALILIAGGIGLINLTGRRGRTELESAQKQIAAVLREAQSRSAARESSLAWGVHFENSTITAPFFAVFSGVYASSAASSYYRLPPTVGYLSSTVAVGSFKEVTFSQLTGAASASTSIGIYLISNPASSSVVSVASSGAVTY